jgi:hypothetical protein
MSCLSLAGNEIAISILGSRWEGDEHEPEVRHGLLEGRVAHCDFDEGWRLYSPWTDLWRPGILSGEEAGNQTLGWKKF